MVYLSVSVFVSLSQTMFWMRLIKLSQTSPRNDVSFVAFQRWHQGGPGCTVVSPFSNRMSSYAVLIQIIDLNVINLCIYTVENTPGINESAMSK